MSAENAGAGVVQGCDDVVGLVMKAIEIDSELRSEKLPEVVPWFLHFTSSIAPCS